MFKSIASNYDLINMEEKSEGRVIPTNLVYRSKVSHTIQKLLASRIFNCFFSDITNSNTLITQYDIFRSLTDSELIRFGGSL